MCIRDRVYPVWDCLCFLDLGGYFLSHVKEVFDYNLFKYFLGSFLSLFSFWDPYNVNVIALMLPQRSLRLSSFLFILFSLFCSAAVNSTICLPGHLSVLLPQLFCYWFLLVYFSFQLLYCSSVFFTSCRSLLNISCIFLMPPFFFQDLGSSLLSLLWILFLCYEIRNRLQEEQNLILRLKSNMP